MKKNNFPHTDDDIDLGNLIKSLWREKILILSISIICGLVGYLYASFKFQEFIIEIKLRNPPAQLFEAYTFMLSNPNTNTNTSNIHGEFVSNFKLNFLSLDNLQSFVEESKDLENFKKYLKSKNITAKEYFKGQFNEVSEKNSITPNKYSLVFSKELAGDIFLNNYTQFIKKKTILELKKNIKLLIENKINYYDLALEKAKLINLTNPIQRSINEYVLVSKPEDLFYKGTIILSQEIISLKRLLIKLENEQFYFDPISDNGLSSKLNPNNEKFYIFFGILVGLFFSIIIIFFKNALSNKL